jgi:hypothetical protein
MQDAGSVIDFEWVHIADRIAIQMDGFVELIAYFVSDAGLADSE